MRAIHYLCPMRGVVLLFLFLASISSFAQKRKKEKSFLVDQQHWTVEIPVWVPGFKGAFSYGDVSLEGEDGVLPVIPDDPTQLPEEDTGNIFSRLFSNDTRLRFFFISRVSYQHKRFFAQVDAIGGSIGSSVKYRYNNRSLVESSFNISLARAYLGYRLLEKVAASGKSRVQLYGYLGTRLYFLKVKSSLDNANISLSISPVWADPLVGLQFQLDLKHWQFLFASDAGGLNFSNRISFANQLTVYYRASKLISVRGGWFAIEIRHKGSFLSHQLTLRTHLSGPSLGVGFHF